MWSKVLKWLKTNNEEVTDIILDIVAGTLGIAILGYLLSKYIEILFEVAMRIGEKM